MKCPRGCQYVQRYGTFAGQKQPAKLSVVHRSLSKSGKTLYEYYQCPKCKRVFKKGHRIHKWKEPKKE